MKIARPSKSTTLRASKQSTPTAPPNGRPVANEPAPLRANSPEAEAVTEVAAKVDVGFGNQLYIRGCGNGLRWDKGVPLQCTDASTWVWLAQSAKDKLVFKLLLNDQIWAKGDDVVLEPGNRLVTTPQF